VWRKSRFLEHSIGRQQHAGAWALERRLSYLVLPGEHRDGRIIWTEPVKYWRKACVLACLNHTVPSLQTPRLCGSRLRKLTLAYF
jgi:hypothetical protein